MLGTHGLGTAESSMFCWLSAAGSPCEYSRTDSQTAAKLQFQHVPGEVFGSL